MTIAIIKCPKCAYKRRPDEIEAPERCPACGLYFEKWAMRDVVERARKSQSTTESDPDIPEWRAALRERLMHIPDPLYVSWVYGRAALLFILLLWGFRMAALDYRDGEMGGSFMHLILLPIHEAGHVLFMPFGQFLMILGGSLFQLLMPLIVAGALFWQNRDPVGAAVGIWWCGVSLMDLAPYIYDAKNPQLILLGGHTGQEGAHDWIYLLDVFGKIEQAHRYGFIVHKIGIMVMLAALAVGIFLLWRIWKSRNDGSSAMY